MVLAINRKIRKCRTYLVILNGGPVVTFTQWNTISNLISNTFKTLEKLLLLVVVVEVVVVVRISSMLS